MRRSIVAAARVAVLAGFGGALAVAVAAARDLGAEGGGGCMGRGAVPRAEGGAAAAGAGGAWLGGVSLLGLGGAFWGSLAGMGVLAVDRCGGLVRGR